MFRRATVSAIGVSLWLAHAATAPYFADITATSRLAFLHANSPTSNKYLIETMGGGVALLDYDNDGRLDIFFTNGARLEDPMQPGKEPDKSDEKYWNRLYHQNNDGTFTDVTMKAGVRGRANEYSMGVAVGDYDNDGFPDLYVTAFGSNTLFHNNGGGTFTDVTAKAGVAASGWSSSAGFFDYDNDGKLDLFVGRYLDWTFATNRYCGERLPGRRAYCHPDNFPGIANVLFHNNGDGTFTDVSQAAGIANPKGKTLGVAFADYDNDGWTDIYVSNDSVQCFLYHNLKNGKFKDESLLAGVGFNEDGGTFAGMGTEFADYDNDGWPDIFVTDLGNEIYRLFRNSGDGSFTDVVTKSGIAEITLLNSGWGTKFADFDNDGWKDIFVAQGHVMDTIHLTSPQLRYKMPPLLLRNTSQRFTPVSGGESFERLWAGRGAAFGDIDNDGDIDVVVSNCGEAPYILRNEIGNRNHWILLKAIGTKSNRDAIGARVKVVGASGLTQYFTINTAGSYQSASDPRLVIGLGQDTTAKLIEIRWPSGTVQKLENVKADQAVAVKEPAS